MENAEARTNSNAVKDFLIRMGVIGELLTFLWKRKLYWLIPMILTLLLFAVIIILGQSGIAGSFIYILY